MQKKRDAGIENIPSTSEGAEAGNAPMQSGSVNTGGVRGVYPKIPFKPNVPGMIASKEDPKVKAGEKLQLSMGVVEAELDSYYSPIFEMYIVRYK